MSQLLETGIEHHKAGRLAEAEPIYRRVLQSEPANPQALHLLGMLQMQTGRAPDALKSLRAAAQSAPQVAQIHFALSTASRLCGQLAEAQAAAQKSIGIRPLFAPAHNELGLALVNQGRMTEAIASWRRAVQLKPDYAEALSNLGAALAQEEQVDEAIKVLRQVLELNPNYPAAHNNLANALDEAGYTEDAIFHWQKAVELKPDFFDALQNLAKAIHQRGDDATALELITRAIAADPKDPHARFLHGLILLTQGNLADGFPEYEFRTQSKHFDLKGRAFPQPRWDGGDVAGKRLLLHTEQGLGDTIQFSRYATLLAERGAEVIFESPPELVELLKRLDGVREIVIRGEPLPSFDLHASVVSLPMLFKTTLETIPAKVPYLSPPPERIARWSEILGESTGTRRVGLVWAGNPDHTNDAQRSIPLAAFDPLASVPGVTWFSLQKTRSMSLIPAVGSALGMIDHTTALLDFADTAALISQLDLVITVDTAVAHLAGAMGKPVWTLVAYVPDWRWLKDRTDSPWYPSMRIFRQSTLGNWSSVIGDVGHSLTQG